MVFDRGSAAAWYRKNRARSRAFFDLIAPEAYYEQPIALRHPIVFYEGHLPAFSFNTLVKKGLGGASIDERLETLFARGIDPDESANNEQAITTSNQRRATSNQRPATNYQQLTTNHQQPTG